MTALTLAVRFAAGHYHAHNANGHAEWPPAPARIATALLATAYEIADPAAVHIARRLFDLAPPILWTPPASERHTDTSRWVPADHGLPTKSGKGLTFGRKGNLRKPPERGTVVDDEPLYVRWDDTTFTDDDLETLDRLLRNVTYLGRPTSPVIIDRVALTGEDTSRHTTWMPDPDGAMSLTVATAHLLQALDNREAERDAIGITGHHPHLTARTRARYRSFHPSAAASQHAVLQPASRALTLQIGNDFLYYRTPNASPDDAPAVIQALTSAPSTPQDLILVPVYGRIHQQGLATSRLFGVISSHALDPDPYLRGREPVAIPPPRPHVASEAARNAIAQTWGTSTMWTTLAPVPDNADSLLRDIHVIAERNRARILHATTHDSCRHPNGPDTACYPHATHLSILFESAVPGPLTINGVALLPFNTN